MWYICWSHKTKHSLTGTFALRVAHQITQLLLATYYRIAENLQGRKLLQISRFCGYMRKFSLRNLETWHPLGHKRASAKDFSTKIVFSTNSRKLSLFWKFSTICYANSILIGFEPIAITCMLLPTVLTLVLALSPSYLLSHFKWGIHITSQWRGTRAYL